MSFVWKMIRDGEEVGEGTLVLDDEAQLVFSPEAIDVVRYPAEVRCLGLPEFGKVDKFSLLRMQCPNCGEFELRQEYLTEHGICVCNCIRCLKYSWYKRQAGEIPT